MNSWYEKQNGKWVFCYSVDKEEQETIDKVMTEAVKIFRGEKE